jgi:hypothetical protein
MTKNVIIFLRIIILGFFLFVSAFFVVRPVLAQVDTTSSTSTPDVASLLSTSTTDTTDASTSTPALGELGAAESSSADATTRPPALDELGAVASTSADATTTAPYVLTPATEPPPQDLTEVHVIGTKYTDYFTDGTTVSAYPGDPEVDGNLNKRDAPIPTHAGLSWVHTSSTYLYDTPSGDLDIGDYAAQPDGSYIENASPFVSSTSTPAQSQATNSPSSEAPVLTETDSSTTTDVFAHSNQALTPNQILRRQANIQTTSIALEVLSPYQECRSGGTLSE